MTRTAMRRRAFCALVAVAWLAPHAGAQQVPDRGFSPTITQPQYAPGRGPAVCVDDAHHNFHTLDERFWAFGELLRRDGFAVRASSRRLQASTGRP